MKILIFGIGGIGGYFGGRLALSNSEVTFYCRGKHKEQILKNDLLVKSIKGDFRAKPKLVTDSFDELEVMDLILFCVKSWQLTEVVKSLKPYISENTVLLPLQNGVDNVTKIQSVDNKGQVLSGLCRIVSKVEAPGVINHFSYEPEIVFGDLNNTLSRKVRYLKKFFERSGIKATIPKDIHLEVWKKYAFITSISALGGLTRAPIGRIREDTYLRKIMIDTLKEIKAVANVKGIYLTSNHLDEIINSIDKNDYDNTASTQRDIMRGLPSELYDFNGYVVKEGARLNVPTPVNEMIFRLLLPMEEVARDKS